MKITNFGVFAAPEEELEGLVHISEISTEKLARPEEVVRVGDVYRMRVIKIETDQRKLGLSIRAYIEATGEDALLKRAPEPEPEPKPKPEPAPSGKAEAAAETEAAAEAPADESGAEDAPAGESSGTGEAGEAGEEAEKQEA